jgi:hypothetical protein
MLFYYQVFKFYKLLIVKENTFQLNEFNNVDLGDDLLIADPTLGSGVPTSTEGTLDEYVNLVSPVVVEFGDRDGVGVGAGGEGESAVFEKKKRQKTSEVWNDSSSIKMNSVKKIPV